ncbi:MAG: gamma-glutamyl-gamma-aminobutyrate hydrolase family protein [Calditrichaeota bacterium]|nr:gamma-glutamyl-gamma-aminobutyrate hydrolase family protein [Calditrichota bacterium]MCB9366347.1 gamma-glutamyl-gamma-aminobutyrate hydrolase family protein [Calditrichota bacterium]
MRTKQNSHPIIGISPGFAGPDPDRKFASAGRVNFCDLNYIEGIANAGGLPFLLGHTSDRDQMERYADHIDGLVLIGGVDVQPERYGQIAEATEQTPVPERDEFEFEFLNVFWEREKPILAICRGFQVLNIFFGGTLVQDIPSHLGPVHHLQSPGSTTIAHSVRLEEGSLLHSVFGETQIDVNSFHHQTIEKLGRGLKAVGWSDEGLIEVIEHEANSCLLAVQWHPERMRDSEQQLQLFKYFVDCCARERLEVVG